MTAETFRLVFGEPIPRPVRTAPGGPGSKLRAFERAVALRGVGSYCWPGSRMGGGRFENVVVVYKALPDGVRAALRHAAEAGCIVSIGTHTPRDNWKYEPRKALAIIRGEVPKRVALVLTLAGFRERRITSASKEGPTQWHWTP